MRGIPVEFPIEDLVGLELIQVCFGQNELIFRMEENSSITIESAIELKSMVNKYIENFSDASVKILKQIGNKIISSYSDNGRDLIINFHEESIRIIDNSDQFESYSIFINNRLYVV